MTKINLSALKSLKLAENLIEEIKFKQKKIEFNKHKKISKWILGRETLYVHKKLIKNK